MSEYELSEEIRDGFEHLAKYLQPEVRELARSIMDPEKRKLLSTAEVASRAAIVGRAMKDLHDLIKRKLTEFN